MTVPKAPGSIEAVTAQICRIFSPEVIEDATGKKVGSFYEVANPNSRYQLHFKDAIALDNILPAYGHPRLFTELWRQQTDLSLGHNTASDIKDCLFTGAKEFGDLCGAYQKAIQDGVFTLDERREKIRQHRGGHGADLPYFLP